MEIGLPLESTTPQTVVDDPAMYGTVSCDPDGFVVMVIEGFAEAFPAWSAVSCTVDSGASISTVMGSGDWVGFLVASKYGAFTNPAVAVFGQAPGAHVAKVIVAGWPVKVPLVPPTMLVTTLPSPETADGVNPPCTGVFPYGQRLPPWEMLTLIVNWLGVAPDPDAGAKVGATCNSESTHWTANEKLLLCASALGVVLSIALTALVV